MASLIKKRFQIGVIFLLLMPQLSFAKETYLDLNQAQKLWGSQPFQSKVFKTADAKTRAAMAVDLIKEKKYLGQSFDQVKNDLGKPNGYLDTEQIPAYILSKSTLMHPEVWQLVFLPDKSGDHVESVKINKNCCD